MNTLLSQFFLTRVILYNREQNITLIIDTQSENREDDDSCQPMEVDKIEQTPETVAPMDTS